MKKKQQKKKSSWSQHLHLPRLGRAAATVQCLRLEIRKAAPKLLRKLLPLRQSQQQMTGLRREDRLHLLQQHRQIHWQPPRRNSP